MDDKEAALLPAAPKVAPEPTDALGRWIPRFHNMILCINVLVSLMFMVVLFGGGEAHETDGKLKFVYCAFAISLIPHVLVFLLYPCSPRYRKYIQDIMDQARESMSNYCLAYIVAVVVFTFICLLFGLFVMLVVKFCRMIYPYIPTM